MFALTPPYLKSAARICFLPALVFLLSALVFVLSACNGTQEATIQGKVELDGELLKSGTVSFICQDSKPHSAAISDTGTYKIEKVPPGPAKIQVKSHARTPFGKFKGPNPKNDPKAADPVLEIPEKYNDAQKSGLTYDVKPGPGPHTHDIRLQKR